LKYSIFEIYNFKIFDKINKNYFLKIKNFEFFTFLQFMKYHKI